MITIDKFNELTSKLIGQPLTQVSDSYGDVFVLHFGNLNNYTHPKLSHLKQGDYELVIKMSKCGLICVRNYSELKQVKIDCLFVSLSWQYVNIHNKLCVDRAIHIIPAIMILCVVIYIIKQVKYAVK